jgi:hypothetical protein
MKYILIMLLLISCSNKNEVSNYQSKADSLHDKLFNTQVELGRYETTLEILKEKDSVAAQKFEHIMYTETE